jgi:GT2 family glycosyltransferase
MQFPKNTRLTYHLIGSSLVYEARESIAKYAIENNCEYVLYLDSDMVPPTDMIVKMVNIFDLRPEAGMVTGMAFKRIPPFQPCFYTKLAYDTQKMEPILESPIDWPATAGLIEIQGAGMACSMIKTEIFKQIPKPWFFPLPGLGEDLTFCLKAKQKGVKMYVDTSIDVGHISSMPITKDHFIACRDEHKKQNTGQPLFKEVT